MGIKDWVLLGLLLLVFLVRWLKGRSAGIEGKKATAAGGKAVQILEAAGYEILLVKPTLTVQMEIDGQPHSFTLKNDYLVKRHGQRYLVRRDATIHECACSRNCGAAVCCVMCWPFAHAAS